jgi:hypothetical protein
LVRPAEIISADVYGGELGFSAAVRSSAADDAALRRVMA